MNESAENKQKESIFSNALILKLNKRKAILSYSFYPFRKGSFSQKEVAKYESFMVGYFLRQAGLIEKTIEFENKWQKSSQFDPQRYINSYFFWRQGGLSHKERMELEKIVWIPDERIYEFIELEGPVAFSFSKVQDKINIWSEDIKSLKRRLDKVTNSLLYYARKRSAEASKKKRGRPENELIRLFGRAWVKNIYIDIMSVLQNVRMQKIRPTVQNAYRIIQCSHKKYFTDMIDRYKQKELSQEDIHIVSELDSMIKHIAWRYNPIMACLRKDKKLMLQFLGNEWQPNRLARQITAKLLDITENTLDHILFPRKTR